MDAPLDARLHYAENRGIEIEKGDQGRPYSYYPLQRSFEITHKFPFE